MRIITPDTTDQLPEIAACIGFFDGVHLGHRFLIGELKAEAQRRGLASAVITFRNHPRKLIDHRFRPDLISTFDEKMEKLSETGVDYCIVLDFNPELREKTARQFITEVLREKLNARVLLIGYDHRFGKNRSSGFEDYQRYGRECGVEVVKEPDFSPHGLHISSSEIRRALLAGKPQRVIELAGEPYSLTGTVVDGLRIGRTIGYPTANVVPSDPDKIIPHKGVYAVWVEFEGIVRAGMLNIGNRPTIDPAGKMSIEVNILDFEGDLYGQTLRITFISYLRDERRMESLDDLKHQLSLDREKAIAALFPEK